MAVSERYDPVASVETLLNEVFLNAFRNDGVREHLGFENISPVPSRRGLPGWYLWFKDMAGVFFVGMTEGDEFSVDGEESANYAGKDFGEVQLVIRYFPGTEEDLFDTFSCYEQIARIGPDFDDIGAPVFESNRAMRDDYFVVGHMSMSRNGSTGGVDFRCRGPEKWQVYRTDGLSLEDSSGAVVQVLSSGERDRNVPGWILSRYCFDRIVSAYRFMICRPPSSVGASYRPSVCYHIDRTDRVKVEKDEDLKFFTLLVAFSHGDDPHDTEKRLTCRGDTLVGLWDDLQAVPAEWSNPFWLTIHEHACHQDHGELCSCFRDH